MLMIQFLIFTAVLLLQACASNSGYWNTSDYTVKSGDTIYSIAWRYELDPVELARWNHISTRHFLIHPGQRLHIHQPAGLNKPHREISIHRQHGITKPTQRKPGWIRIQPGDTLYGVSKKYAISQSQLVQLNRLKPPWLLQPGQKLLLRTQVKTRNTIHPTYHGHNTTVQKTTAQKTSGRQLGRRWARSIHWQWPVRGKIVSAYVKNRHNAKGIDIRGNMGERVNAAADGKVVYSGNGLISYGNLVIIKHNKHYLSAYAYNHKLLVHEGQWVRAGQQIAEMGRKGNTRPRLHFEIRRNGKPVNPQHYLP